MTEPVDQQLLADALEIVEGAAALTLDWFQRADLVVDRKRDGSEVTAADRAAETYVREQVLARYPNDTVIGEEHGSVDGRSGRRWIVDPIDGTASFVRGVPLYSTLLAVIDEHGPAVGAVVIPAIDERVIAGRGRGCTHNGAAATVSRVTDLTAACISSSAFDASWWPEPALLNITRSGAKTRTWGDGYGYLLVATGRIEAMIDPPLNLWDIAPMLTVIPEAGGEITTWRGSTALEHGAGWAATNGLLHQPILDMLD